MVSGCTTMQGCWKKASVAWEVLELDIQNAKLGLENVGN
jgi:hypothetical protein